MSFVVNLCVVVVSAVVVPACKAQKDWISEIDQINVPELDKEWREYVDKLGGEYEEVTSNTPTSEEPDPNELKDFRDWNPTSPGEVPFLAILYVEDNGTSELYKEYFKDEPDPGFSHIEPGTACGGALLSPQHILTSCGCLFQVITERIYPGTVPPFEKDDESPRYRLLNYETPGKAPSKVYVTFSLLQFVPDRAYELDEDAKKWPNITHSNCKSFIATDGETLDPNIRGKRINGELIIVPFKKGTDIEEAFPKWPPPLIRTDCLHHQHESPGFTPKEHVIVVASVGMRLVEKTKIPFHSSIQVSSLEQRDCHPSDLTGHPICSKIIWETEYSQIEKTHVCYCPVTKNQKPQLVGGTIGWPVVSREGYLIGLTASERRPEDGTIAVALITKDRIGSIERYVGKRILQEQNSPQDVFRRKDLKDEFFIYDYWGFLTKQAGKTRSGATNLDTGFSIFLFLLGGFLRP